MLIDKAALSVRHCADADSFRPSTNGIVFEQTRTIASDGHKLVIVQASKLPAADFPLIDGLSSEPAQFAPFTISVDAATQLAKSIPKSKYGHAIIETALLDEVKSAVNGKAHFGVTDLDTRNVLEFKKGEHTHLPDYDKVIDRSEPVATITLNANYIADIAKVARECSELKSKDALPLTFELHDLEGQKQVRITSSAAPRFEAVLMPMRK